MLRKELATLLRDAAAAHHAYEIETGKPDDEWADWYARWMLPHFAVIQGKPRRTSDAKRSRVARLNAKDRRAHRQHSDTYQP